MGMSEKIIPSAAYGVAFGALGYLIGSMGHEVISAISPLVYGVIFFAAAVAVGLSKN